MTGQLDQTGRRIVAGTWGCAVITMAASAANAALTYGALGDNRVLGLATGVAVDIGLCVALIGDRQLYTHGLSSNWGRALRVTTAVMSLILNVGISLRNGHYFAALLHSFLPVLLIVLCEYGQDVLLQLTALRRELESAQAPTSVAPVGPVAVDLPAPTYQRVVPPSSWVALKPVVASQPEPVVKPVESQSGPQRAGAELHTSSAPKPAPPADDDLVTRVRKLIADTNGQVPGRRTVARELGVTEHAARQAIELVTAGTPASNGNRPAKSTGNGQVTP